MTPCQLLPPFLSEGLVIRQHVRMSLTWIVDRATVGVAIAELAVSRLAVLAESLTIGAGAGASCVDHGVVGMGRQQLVFAFPTHRLLFLK